MDERAFSSDGYIIDQSALKNIKYGVYPSSINGCGWVAAYNILHSMSDEEKPEDVFDGVLSILPYQGSMGTPTATMLEYLRSCGLSARLIRGKKNILAGMDSVERGILRYKEMLGDHYVAFVREDALRYRFLRIRPARSADLRSFHLPRRYRYLRRLRNPDLCGGFRNLHR